MNRSRPPFRDRDAGARRAAQASAARKKRLTKTPPTAEGGPVSAETGAPLPPGRQQDQPVPWGWQSTASELRPALRRYDTPNYVIVPPQEPPMQPQRIMLSGSAVGGGAGPGHAPQQSDTASPFTIEQIDRIKTNYHNLLLLAISLEKMARDEISRLSGANDPDTIEHNKRQIDLLSILADGFAKIAAALQEYSKDPQPLLAGKAKEVVNWAGTQLQAWWEANAVEGRDWLVRLPVIGASLAAFGLAGADMHFATPLVGALVGGPKAVAAIKAARRPVQRRSD